MSSIAARLLAKDPTRIGEVYRLYADGKTQAEICEVLGHSNPTNVIENIRVIETMVTGIPETTELTEKEKAYLVMFINRWNAELPDEIVNWGAKAEVALGNLGEYLPSSNHTPKVNSTPSPMQELSAIESASVDEVDEVPGVYAYSYPSLITSASFREESPLLKIGASSNLKKRVSQQASKTEVPEDLVLLWSIEAPSKEDAFLLETHLHALLRLFGKWRKTSESGSEWFQIDVITLRKLTDIVIGE